MGKFPENPQKRVGVVFYPNPLDSRAIGPLVKKCAVTFLLATPTFLQIYLRGCQPADFGSLRLVMTAAEKLPDRLASACCSCAGRT